MNKKRSLVLGASNNPFRYAYKAVNFLKAKGHEVIAIGNSGGEVLGVPIKKSTDDIKNIDTVTLYLNPMNQRDYYDFLIKLNPKRVIFNPGTENKNLEEILNKNGIKTINACTLVMLNTNQY